MFERRRDAIELPPIVKKRSRDRTDEGAVAALARAAGDSFEAIVCELEAKIASLRTQTQRFQFAVDAMQPGVCFFDEEARLALCNRRYVEIYCLSPADVQPGTTFRQIVERSFAANSCPAPVLEYLEFRAAIRVANEQKVWIDVLPNGRVIRVWFRPMPKGGWATTHEDITERRDAPAVVDQRISLQTLIDLLPDYLWVKDAANRFVVVNKAVADDFGRGNPSDMIGLTDFDIHGPDAATGFWAIEKEILTTGRAMINQEELVLTHSGKRKWNSTTKVPFRSETGEIIGLVAATRDISARKSAEALRDGQAEVLELIASSAPLATTLDRLVRMVESQLDGILGSVMLLDEGGCHLRFGAAPNLAKSYLQAADGMRIGPEAVAFGAAVFRREPVVVADIATDPPWQDYPAAALAHGYRSCWSTPIVSRLGEVLGVFVMYSTSIREPTSIEAGLLGTSVRIAGIAIDRERAEARINFMATHDTLTGLPNRALLEDRLVQALLLAQRYDRWATVAFVDLDNFKVINDTLGHRAGDEVLKVTAARMVGCLRSTDTVVRLGGDEFVVVLSDQSKNSETVSGALQKLRAALTETIDVAGRVLRVTCSIGVANYPNDGRDAETLLANADAAMYRAKELGRDNVQFHMA